MNHVSLGYSNVDTIVLSLLGLILLTLVFMMVKRLEKGPPNTDIGRILLYSFFLCGLVSVGAYCQLPALLWLFSAMI